MIAAKAVAFAEAARPEFRTYAAQVVANAAALGEALAEAGFRLVSGGTENHQVLVDLRTFDEELTGKVAQEVLDRAGITCNRNTIPDDPRSPVHHLRPPAGLGGPDHRGHGPGRDADHRGPHRPDPAPPGRRSRGRARCGARCTSCARASLPIPR